MHERAAHVRLPGERGGRGGSSKWEGEHAGAQCGSFNSRFENDAISPHKNGTCEFQKKFGNQKSIKKKI